MLKVSVCFWSWAESRKQVTEEHTMDFDLFWQTAFLGKFSVIHRKCWWKKKKELDTVKYRTLLWARQGVNTYLFWLTLEVMWLGIVLGWVPLLQGQVLTLRRKISDGSSSGSLRNCCLLLPALSLCQRLLILRCQATNSSGQGTGSL